MIRLRGIKNIVFDFGGVLVDLNPAACIKAFTDLGMQGLEEYMSPFGHKGPFGEVENGDISIEEFRDRIKEEYGKSHSDKEIDDAWAAYLMHVPENKMRMVHELAKKYRVFLLSNTNPIHIRKLQEFEEHGYPLKECFEKLYLSYEVKRSKPDPEIFRYVLKDAGILPSETLFIDDGAANCKVAESLGINTYKPEPFEDFSGELLRPEKCVATMGFFDGVHKGHISLIEEAKKVAAEKCLPSMIVSFWPHPRMVLHSDFCPQLLTSREEKENLLKKTGVDYVHTLNFDERLAGLSARQFMKEVLKDELNVTSLVVGFDHRFGNGRLDGFEEYRKYGDEFGIEVTQAKPLYFSKIITKEEREKVEGFIMGGATISSSLIRRLILSGRVAEANKALGYTYSIKGSVVSGHRIGTSIGYPTANIEPADPYKLVPVNGVYAVWVDVEGKRYKGMLNIGKRPTLGADQNVTIEVHLLDFSGDLYGKELTASFVQMFRKEQHFPDIESLVAKLDADKEYVNALLH